MKQNFDNYKIADPKICHTTFLQAKIAGAGFEPRDLGVS